MNSCANNYYDTYVWRQDALTKCCTMTICDKIQCLRNVRRKPIPLKGVANGKE